jgi:moderate conductance mechanosensitive channel
LSTNSQALLRALVVVAVELGTTAFILGAAYVAVIRIQQRAAAMRAWSSPDQGRKPRARARNILLVAFIMLAVGIVGYNGWLVAGGIDVPQHTADVLRLLTVEMWRALGVAFGKLALAVLVLLVATRILRRIFGGLHTGITRHHHLSDKGKSVEKLFAGLDRAIVITGWMLIAVLATWLLGMPLAVTDSLLLIVRLYLVFAVGIMLIRAAAIAVDVLDGWGRHYMHARGWVGHYDHLLRLVPTLRACVEYALWISVAALVIVQLGPIRNLAIWGPRLVQAIGIFFAGRVIIEIGHLEIGHRMLPSEGLDEMEHRRRATMVPLVRSVFTYAVYFATAALMLSSLGFNPMPFLAGAGILGLVIGFGAQSLINDVVSGFFILFENVYLVGDLVEAAGARGVVEAIEFRVTKIRDGDGRLHIIRNGDMKPVINYSKDYTMAVVPVEVAYDRDLRAVFATLLEAGARVRASDANVLGETRIDGITNFGSSTMTVRTSTRVRPGCHEAIAASLRLAIKEGFDRQGGVDAPRTALVPEPARARR